MPRRAVRRSETKHRRRCAFVFMSSAAHVTSPHVSRVRVCVSAVRTLEPSRAVWGRLRRR
eukprot:7387126-Prymnesium_polylepis.1